MSNFKLPPQALAQHIAVLGKTGSGKTFAVKGIVEHLLEDGRRVCILDPTGVWYGLRSSADGKKPGYPVAVFGGEHADVPIAEHSGAALAKIIASKNLPAIIDLSEMLIGQRHKFVTDFAEAIYADNRAPLHLVIDEADEFCPQNPMPETKRMLHHVDRIVRKGRVRGFRVMLITQRPAVLHKNVLTQANTLVAMRLTAPQDRKAMQAWVEGQADADQAKEVLGSLARLQRGEGWVWAPELGILTRTTFPKITTFDSSRTPEDDETVIEPSKLATVDLGEVRASFEVVEKELRSMKELQAEVTKLRKELASRREQVATTKSGPSEVEVQRRIKEAVADVHKMAAAQVQKVAAQQADPAHMKTLRKIAQLVAPYAEVRVDGGEIGPLQREVNAVLPQRKSSPPPGPTSEGVSGPQQRILDGVAWLGAFGIEEPSRECLGARIGIAFNGGGFRNNLGALRTAGLIDYPTGGTVALSDAGRAKANAPAEVPTLQALHDSWLAFVTNPQAAILRALIDAHPDSLSRDELASRVGVVAAGGGFRNNLGRLRTLGAIEYPTQGDVRAADTLFPKGKA